MKNFMIILFCLAALSGYSQGVGISKAQNASTYTFFPTSVYNVIVGNSAGTAITTGNSNSIVGYEAGQANTSGTGNSFYGAAAGVLNTSGGDNTFIGGSSGNSNTTGANDVFLGNGAGLHNTTGNFNVAIGDKAGTNNTTGTNNIFIGQNAAANTNPLNNSIAIGTKASFKANNAVAIGQLSTVTSDNTIILGQDITSATPAQVGIGVTGGYTLQRLEVDATGNTIRFDGLQDISTSPAGYAGTLVVDGNNDIYTSTGSGMIGCSSPNIVVRMDGSGVNTTCSQIYDDGTSVGIGMTSGFGYTAGATLAYGTPTPPSTFTLAVNGWASATAFVALSDQNYKKDIKPIENALDKVGKLNGVTYLWNKDVDKTRKLDDAPQIGFLAQEVQTVLPEAVVKNDKGVYGLNYNMIIPVLTEAIKDLKKQNDNLQAELNDICSGGCSTLSGSSTNTQDNKLLQNAPNPFSGMTTIGYVVNTGTTAYMNINTLDGKVIKHIDLAKGSGTVSVSSSDLSAGTYTYTLFVDGKTIDTKIMVVTAMD